MEEKLINVLESLGFEVYEQGSFTDTKDYPESFFTFWNLEAEGQRFYDNEESAIAWTYDVNFYSTDPAIITETIKKAKAALRADGWICAGMGRAAQSGTHTHAGRTIEAIFIS